MPISCKRSKKFNELPMPIVDVEIVLRPTETLREGLALELADRIGKVFGAPTGTTWVKVHGLSSSQYAESGGTPEEVYPVFVSVLKSKLPLPEEMQVEVDGLTAVIAQTCQRPKENIHVLYLPEGRGRIAFGGEIVS